MALEYVAAYYSYLDFMAELSDAECGRLFKACLTYGKTGAVPELRGNERFVWPGIKSQIDRDAEKYKARCEQNRNNRQRTSTNDNDRSQPSTKPTKEKAKAKAKAKEKEKAKERSPGGDSNAPARADSAAAYYYLDRVNPMASQASLEELAGFEATMGTAVCRRAIDIALDERKASWSYIRAILRDKQAKGVHSLADWDGLEAERGKSTTQPSGRGSWAELAAQMDAEEGLL